MGLVVIFLVTIFVSLVFVNNRSKYLVKEVLADGTLVLNDSRKIEMAGAVMDDQGSVDHEKRIFLLREMTKNVEVWPERVGDGYQIWIGCKNVLWMKDCKKGVLLNEVLVMVGSATKD